MKKIIYTLKKTMGLEILKMKPVKKAHDYAKVMQWCTEDSNVIKAADLNLCSII